ncbi:MAG: hypothetical protein OHK93_005653 [Ramalina farinacea]|uniref:Uncharacterized protein n=1 Tax=Ramalina farinacea TaxID=258253 RepID=A0AA43QLC6_9LECA|nr:hypothetical protein [Ramalina farinacea]
MDGRCQSKYYENVGKILEMQEIRVSPYWKDVQDDTIFRPIVDEGKTRSVEECLEKVQQRLRPQSEEELLHKSRSESRSLAPRSAEAIGMAESLETLERALAEAKAKQAEMIRNRKKIKQRRVSDAQHNQPETAAQSPMVKKEHQSPPFSASPNESAVESRSTEDVLAALGVTGASKPGTAVAGRGHQRPSSTMSPHYPKQQSQQLQGMNGHAQGSPPSKPYAQHFPMAQEIQTPTYSDGSNVHSPDSSRRLYTNGTNGNGPYPYSVEESTMSPTQYQSERSQSHKRSYEQREESSSSEDGSSPRRQEDDILPKHKKRQPQVAAAYR